MREEFKGWKHWLAEFREHGKSLKRYGSTGRCSEGCPCGDIGDAQEFLLSAEPQSAAERAVVTAMEAEFGQ